MTQPQTGATPGAIAPGTPHHSPHHSIWDRLLDDLHKHPRRYINGVLLIAIPVFLVILGVKFWRTRQQEAAGTTSSSWMQLWAPDKTAQERVGGLQELGAKVETPEQKAMVLYDLAVSYKELAEEASTNDEKIAHLEKSLAAAKDLKSKYPNHLWSKIPTRPPTSTGTPTAAAVDQIIDHAQRQIDWFKQHPYSAAVEPDPNLKVTFELEDGRKFVVGKLFSRAAPYHVQSFVELARRGYFDGTGFTRLTQAFKKGATPKQGDTPPQIAIEGGHVMTKVTPDDRADDENQSDVGFSIRDEANQIPVGRGSVTAVLDASSGGDSPSRFKIYSDAPGYTQDTVFAEVTEGLEVVDALVNAIPADAAPSRPRDLVRIKKVTVEGSVLAPPEEVYPPELKLPAAPKPESAPQSRPETQGTESQPESRAVETQKDREPK